MVLGPSVRERQRVLDFLDDYRGEADPPGVTDERGSPPCMARGHSELIFDHTRIIIRV